MTARPIRECARQVRRRTSHLVGAAVVALLLTVPGAASAAVTSNSYTSGTLQYGNGVPLQACRGWSGDADSSGRHYAACHAAHDTNGDGRTERVPALLEFNTDGRLARIGHLPAAYYFNDSYLIRDIAVRPDGNVAYVSVGPITDNLGANPQNDVNGQRRPGGATAGSILRLVRNSSDQWVHDPSWKAGPFRVGQNYWAARNLDVDESGRIYVSVNQFVYELDHRTGQVVSSFGESTTNGPWGAWIDGMDVPQGVAVAADGNSIYVVEQKYHLVQRWERVGATSWRRDTDFLLGHAGEEGDEYCDTDDHFQSPYDVGFDAQGDVYVMDVTCNRVQRFSSRGTFQETVWSDLGADRVHGFAVSGDGTVTIPTRGLRLVRNGGGGGGGGGGVGPGIANACTDRQAPVITDVELASRTTSRTVTVNVTATDDCPTLSVRVTGDRSGTAAWVSGRSQRVALSGASGTKVLTITVRDIANRTATRSASTTLVLPRVSLRVRARVALPGSGCRAGNPLDFVANPSAHRVVDRCARISGRVTKFRRSGSGYAVQLLLPLSTARAIYSNAVGPARVWIVTDRLTRRPNNVRVGRRATVVGPVIAKRNLREAFVMPVTVLRGG